MGIEREEFLGYLHYVTQLYLAGVSGLSGGLGESSEVGVALIKWVTLVQVEFAS